jgi:uncharacterized membrane protein HdeD (DUF308 family)
MEGAGMAYAPAWKIALIGAVAVTAGCALVVLKWTVPQLAPFLAMLFIGRGALHVVTTSLNGMAGALFVLLGLGELSVGVVLLVWPSPTLLVVVVVVGVWTVARAVTLGMNLAATRRQFSQLRFVLIPPLLEIAIGVALFARASGTARDVAVIIGALMIIDGGTELLLAAEAKRHGRRALPLVVSS